MTNTERLQFAVEFSRMNLAGLLAWQKMKLSMDIRSFVGGPLSDKETALGPALGFRLAPSDLPNLSGDPSIEQSDEPMNDQDESESGVPAPPRLLLKHPHELQKFSMADAERLQQHVRKILASVTDIRVGVSSEYDIHLRMKVHRLPKAERCGAFVTGSTEEAFLMRLVLLLSEFPMDSIRQCQNCPTIFFRNRRQEFCSPECRNRFHVEKWRKNHPAKASTAAHQKYVQRVRRKTSAKIQVKKQQSKKRGPR